MNGTARMLRIGSALRVATVVATLAAGCLAVPMLARAEAAPADPIDTAMRSCLARADRSSPSGQARCMNEARQSWSEAIDSSYRALMEHAPDKARHAWQTSQRYWLASRKRDLPLVRAVFKTTHGSAYQISEANVLLQAERDRALRLREAAARYAPKAATPASAASQVGQAGKAGKAGKASQANDVSKASAAAVAASVSAAPSSAAAGDAPPEPRPPLRPCGDDAACEHAQFDLNRYTRKLRAKLPAHARVTLVRAEQAWRRYFDATAGLGTETDRTDLIGARVATVKRLAETAGND